MTTRTLAVVSGGLTDPSSTRLLADRLTTATTDALRHLGIEVAVEVIELRGLARDLTDNLLTGFASDRLQAAKDTIAGADGLIAATPVFSASYTGMFKDLFDLLDEGALVGTPVLLAATAGTARHSLVIEHALRPLFSYLGALTVSTGVVAASEDWGSTGEGVLAERITRAASQLAGFVATHETSTPVDPFASPTPFEQLLKG